MKKKIFIPLIILFLILIIFFIRLILPKEIDDISPEINCPELEKYNPNTLWIIPKFNNISISENKTWCDYILSLNKTLGIHGVTHEYNEFKTNREFNYLQEGIQIFEECFGKKPVMFKPPQLKISQQNKELIKQNNMVLKTNSNQLFHKVYHCNDSDLIKNWVIRLI